MRSILISDVHGCAASLLTLLKALALDPASDRLIFLGDLFDRGPDSWKVFQHVKKLAELFEERFVLLRGNHEDYLLQEKLPLTTRMVWDRVGRGTTVRSFKEHGEMMEDSAPWLREHTVTSFIGEGFQCVHAGLKIAPLELNDFYTMVHDHNVVLENRYNGPLTIVGHIALAQPAWFAGDGKTVKKLPAESLDAGEDPLAGAGLSDGERRPSAEAGAVNEGRKPSAEAGAGDWLSLPEQGVICIDTGCGKGGRLTGMIIENGCFRLMWTAE